MAFQNAKGNAPDTGMPKQPRPAAPDQISKVRAPSTQGYGMNDGASNPSSVAPDKIAQTMSPLAANLKASADDDGVLDHVIAHGTKLDGVISGQLRKIADGNVPTHSAFAKRGAASGSPGGSIPSKNGSPTSDWEARRAAVLRAGGGQTNV
jgi:hypothetical protein